MQTSSSSRYVAHQATKVSNPVLTDSPATFQSRFTAGSPPPNIPTFSLKDGALLPDNSDLVDLPVGAGELPGFAANHGEGNHIYCAVVGPVGVFLLYTLLTENHSPTAGPAWSSV